MKKSTRTLAYLALMMFGVYGCNETKLQSPPSGGTDYDLENQSNKLPIETRKDRLYEYMDFKDIDGNWISNTRHPFFIKKQDNKTITIACKIAFNDILNGMSGEWFETNSIEPLKSYIQNKHEYFIFDLEKVRKTNQTPVVETPVVETPVVETPVVETPVVETPDFPPVDRPTPWNCDTDISSRPSSDNYSNFETYKAKKHKGPKKNHGTKNDQGKDQNPHKRKKGRKGKHTHQIMNEID